MGFIGGEIGARYRAKCRVSGCSLRITESATSGLFRPIHDLLGLNGVGGARDKELVPHYKRAQPPFPFPLSARPRARSMCACARAHCTTFPPLREVLATNRSHSRPKRHSAARVVAHKRVSTKIPAFSTAEINAPFPPIVINNAVLTRRPATTPSLSARKLTRGVVSD